MKVFGLVRVSTEDQGNEDAHAGLSRQRSAISRIVTSQGLQLIKTIEIIDVSGTNVKNSPEFQSLLRAVREKEISGVVVSEMSRLIRPNQFSDLDVFDVFKEAKVIIYTEGQKLDPTTPEGVLMTLTLAGFSGHERAGFLKKVQASKEERRRQGRCPSAQITLPRGVAYDKVTYKWCYTPDSEAVVEAFRIVDEEGLTNMNAIGKRVGIQPRTLHNLLRNPIFIGWRVYDKKRGSEKYDAVDGKQSDRRKILREDDEIIRIKVIENGVVGDERFHRVQGLLNNTATRWRSVRETTEVNPLAGVAICGHCGGRLYGSSGRRQKGKKVGYYMCRQNYYLNKRKGLSCAQINIQKQHLDETVFSFVSEHLTNKDVILRIVEKLEESTKNDASAVTFSRMLKDVTLRKRRLMDAVMDGTFSRAEAKDQSDKLDGEIDAIEGMIASTQKRRKAAENSHRIVERLIKGARAFRRHLSVGEKKKLLHAMFASISFQGCEIVDFQLNESFFDDSVYRTKSRIPAPVGSTVGDTNSGACAEPISHRGRRAMLFPLLDVFKQAVLSTPYTVERFGREYHERAEVGPGQKRCRKCGEVKPIGDFRILGATGWRAYRCRDCERDANREAYRRGKQRA